MNKLVQILCLFFSIIFLSSCLTTEYKEYTFQINEDGSGSGKIKYINIISQEDDGVNASATDFEQLINDYLNGNSFEQENHYHLVTNKRLFEENGVLCGEVEFTFTHIDSVGFTKFSNCECAPLLYYMGALTETLIDTDGNYLGLNRDFPVITWEPGMSEVFIKTMVEADVSNGHSLLAMYIAYRESD
jgi:hypothetical protein